MSHRPWVRLTLAAIVVPLAVGCQAEGSADETAPDSGGSPAPPGEAPAACVDAAATAGTSLDGEPVWARFCPGREGLTKPAEVPSDALTTHLDLLDGIEVAADDRGSGCRAAFSRSYRLQIGYADGRVADISGATDPRCRGDIRGDGSWAKGPLGLGVYGVVMAAFGRQYADAFDAVAPGAPLTCPSDPRKPASVDVDGPSADLETGYHLGRPEPMLMPLTAERGIVCTWADEDDEPTVRALSAADAERVRIGMHAIHNAVVDCAGSADPTHTAVVEDRTGTRRAVTIIDSECATTVRSDGGFGLGFAWLDR